MTGAGGQIRSLVRIAAMTAVLEAGKFLLNAVPNVELVTVLLIVFTLRFGRKETMAAAFLFAALESLWWGLSVWTVTYFYVWPMLVLVTGLIPKDASVWVYAALAAAFGFLFGMLCALTTLIISGWQAAVAWWIAGIPFDLIHGVSNGIVCALLFLPLKRALKYIGN